MILKGKVMKSQVAAVLLLILASCGPETGVTRAEKAAASMQEFRNDITDGKKQVDTVVNTLNALNTAPDLKVAFAAFTAEHDRTESIATTLRSEADQMKASGREFFKKWEEEIEKIKDPDMKAKAKARAGERSKQYSNIEMVMGGVKGTWTTFSGELKDIRQYLTNDLTKKGVESLSATFKKTNLDATELKKSLDAVLASMDAVQADFQGNPAPAPAEKK
jgi:hypothetical protein